MAAPTKKGLDYFPLDIDFFEDEKIQAISGEFGIKGELATIKLLCTIYRNGYYIKWNDLIKNKLTRNLPGVSVELLEQIVQRLIKWEFFNKALFDSDAVLTSAGIQERFLAATKRRKDRLMLTYCIHKPPLNGVNVDINPQSKVKESKVELLKEGSRFYLDGKDISIAVFSPNDCKGIYFSDVYAHTREVLSMSCFLPDLSALETWVDKFNAKQNLNPKLRTFDDWLNHLNNWLPKQNTRPVTTGINFMKKL